MAIAPATTYPGQTVTGDPAYPLGKARNITVAGDGTGTPWEADGVNDLYGAQQALLDAGAVAPNFVPDRVGASNYLSAIQRVARYEVHRSAVANHASFDPSTASMIVTCGFSGRSGGNNYIGFGGTVGGVAQLVFTTGDLAWAALSVGVMGSYFNKVFWSPSLWIGTGPGVIGTASSIASWTPQSVPSTNYTGICAHGGTYVLVGNAGAASHIRYGGPTSWLIGTPANSTDVLFAVASNGTRVVAVGCNAALNAPVVWTSDDAGSTWAVQTIGGSLGGVLVDVIHNGYCYVAVGTTGAVLWSIDAITWNAVDINGAVLRSVVWTGGAFVAAGDAKAILTGRPNAKEWFTVNPRDIGASSGPVDIKAVAASSDLNVAMLGLTGLKVRRTLFY
jgi:hypothetical protein